MALLLLALIIAGLLQVGSRLGLPGPDWTGAFQRIGVLWLGMLGAIAAARAGRHIRVDLLPNYLKGVAHRVAHIITSAVAAMICGLVAYHSGRLILLEYEFESRGLLDLPVWMVQGILPLAFALMTLAYVVNMFQRPEQSVLHR